jgi:hypothetical protein
VPAPDGSDRGAMHQGRQVGRRHRTIPYRPMSHPARHSRRVVEIGPNGSFRRMQVRPGCPPPPGNEPCLTPPGISTASCNLEGGGPRLPRDAAVGPSTTIPGRIPVGFAVGITPAAYDGVASSSLVPNSSSFGSVGHRACGVKPPPPRRAVVPATPRPRAFNADSLRRVCRTVSSVRRCLSRVAGPGSAVVRGGRLPGVTPVATQPDPGER